MWQTRDDVAVLLGDIEAAMLLTYPDVEAIRCAR